MQRGFSAILILVGVVVLFSVVGGAYFFGKQKSPNQNQLSPQSSVVNSPVSSPATPEGDETANWKTYTNNDWGIFFKYPVLWDIKTYGNNPKIPTSLELVSNLSPMIGFAYIDNPKDLSLSEIDQENARKDKERGVGVETPKLTSKNSTIITLKNGSDANYEKDSLCEPSVCEKYTIQHSNKIITITIFPRDNQSAEFRQNIDQILSTFKFTDQNQATNTANWKTYTSTKANYSFKYPTEWPLVNASTSPECTVCVENIDFTPKYNPNSGDNNTAVILVFKEDKIKTLEDYVNIHVKGDSSKVDLQYTTVGAEQAVSYKLSGGIPPLPVIEYAVVKNGMYYIIRLDDSAETNKNKDKNLMLFNEMLSTFNFQ